MAGQTRTLPASWYRSKPLYELEQRAIFSKVSLASECSIRVTDAELCVHQAWYLLGPVTRFKDEDRVAYEMAGVEFVVEKRNKAGGDGARCAFTVSRLADVKHALRHFVFYLLLLFFFFFFFPSLSLLENHHHV